MKRFSNVGGKYLAQTGQAGLGLVELIIALVVIGLVLAVVPEVWQQVNQTRGVMDQKRLMVQVEEGLETYLVVNGYLPCPDVDGDGYEDRSDDGGVKYCTSREGGLPYSDLALPKMDAWKNPWYYRVHQRADSGGSYINSVCQTVSVFGKEGARNLTDFEYCPVTKSFYCSDCDSVCAELCFPIISVPLVPSVPAVPPSPLQFTSAPYYHLATPPVGALGSPYDINVVDAAGEVVSEGIVAVVLSWGKNGDEYNLSNCDTSASSSLTAAEQENCDGDNDFIYAHDSENKDYLLWFDINQAKWALVHTDKYR